MASLRLKGVPEPLFEELKKQAASHRRSLNDEVLYRLERSLGSGLHGQQNLVRETDRVRAEIGIRTTLNEIISARCEGRR